MHDRFSIDQDLSLHIGKDVSIDSIANHVKAFRKKTGDQIKLYDGIGNVFLANIVDISKKSVRLAVISRQTFEKSKIKLQLFLPIISSNQMDQLIARICELEIDKIIPTITERSINLKNEKEIDGKLTKWDKISKGAGILAGKKFSTIISKPVHLTEGFKISDSMEIKLIASAGAEIFLKDYFSVYCSGKSFNSIGLFIGPEGDFSDKELRLSAEFGILPIKLSNFIMSTFTASIFFASNFISAFMVDHVS